MARTAAQAAKLSSQLWAALGYLAGKRTDRDQIAESSKTAISLHITGTVGRSKIDESVSGHLVRSASQSKPSSSAAPADHLVALLLDRMSEKDRDTAVLQITEYKESTGDLPDVTDEQLKASKLFLKRLRSTTQKITSGALVFELKG